LFEQGFYLNVGVGSSSVLVDYTTLISVIPIILFIGIITVKKRTLGDLVFLTMLSALLLLFLKQKQLVEYIIIEHNTVLRIIQLLLVLLLMFTYILRDTEKKEQINMEYSTLVLLAILGIFISMETTELLTIFIALEMQAFTFYTLVSLKKENIYAAEGGLKYFLIGAIASASIILATALIYESTGLTNLSDITDLLPIPDNLKLYTLGGMLIIIGLLFKIGAAPFHLWLPDAYQGASYYTLIFLAIFPKLALIFLLFTLNHLVEQDLTIFLGCILSGIIGSIQAASQTKIKRFLAYGIIFNNTYFLAILLISGKHAFLGLLESMGLYLLVSLLILLAIFLITNEQTLLRLRSLRDLLSIKKTNMFIAFTISIAFFSAAGIPPFLGFYQKYIGLLVLIEKLQNFLSVFLILATILPVYYYLRTTKILFFLTKSTHIVISNISSCMLPQILSGLLVTSTLIVFA
jgi:NADH-quinone oxidoreductase subunit N